MQLFSTVLYSSTQKFKIIMPFCQCLNLHDTNKNQIQTFETISSRRNLSNPTNFVQQRPHERISIFQMQTFFFQLTITDQHIINQSQPLTLNLFVMDFDLDIQSYPSKPIKAEDWFKDCVSIREIKIHKIQTEREELLIPQDQSFSNLYFQLEESLSKFQPGPQPQKNQNLGLTFGDNQQQDVLPSKQKKIQKTKPKRQRKSQNTNGTSKAGLLKKEESKKEKNLSGNKSKYNNMGGFLIGSFSEMLNNRGGFRFQNRCYQIQNGETWLSIDIFLNCTEQKKCEDVILRLKRKIFNMPRKEGSKKDLFKLINNLDSDSLTEKTAKNLIRKELIHNLNQHDWMFEHVQSRDFKPENDDDHGSKKKERHDAYFSYLQAIKEALQRKGQLPKRLNL